MANEQLRNKLAKYLEQYKNDKESGVNQNRVGMALGYSNGSVISSYLKGDYKGNVDALEDKLEEYFRNREAKEAKAAETAEIRLPNDYVPTTVSEKIYQTIRLVHLRKGIVAVVGDSGVGKSMAALKYARDNPSTSVLLEINPVSGTLRSFLRVLARKMDLSERGGNLDLEDRIKGHLLGMNKVLILDEAQNLQFSTLEVLKSWSDGDKEHGVEGVGLALIGNADIEIRMASQKYERHYNRRIFIQRCRREDITRDDVKLLFPMLADKEKLDQFKLMYGMCRSVSAVRGAVYAYMNAASQQKDQGLPLDYGALLAQSQAINPAIGAVGRL